MLAVARTLLGEELQRVEQSTVGVDFVVEVASGGPAGGADGADDIAAVHPVALFDVELGQVAVPSLQPEPVVDNDQVAIRALIAGVDDAAGSRRVDRLTLVADDIEARVEVVRAVHRVAPAPHAGGKPSMGRPER